MPESSGGPTRRNVLAGMAVATSVPLIGSAPAAAAATYRPVIETGAHRTWIGPEWWANRLQDRRNNDGVIECVAPAGKRVARTVVPLTADIPADPGAPCSGSAPAS